MRRSEITASADAPAHNVDRSLEGDTTDGDDGLPRPARIPDDPGHAPCNQSPWLLWKDRADGDITRIASQRFVDLTLVVCRKPDDRARTDDASHRSDRKVRLPNVDAVGCTSRAMSARSLMMTCAPSARRRDDPIGQRRQPRARIVLGAKLQQPGAAA